MPNDAEVTIVIPSYRSAGTLRRCLDAVARQQGGHRFDVLVVHSGSEPLSVDPSAYPSVRFIVERERWLPGRARNWAARRARSPWVLFLDADCDPEPTCVQSMLRTAAGLDVDGVGCAVANAARWDPLAWTMHLLEFGPWLPRAGRPRLARNFPSCGALYRRSVLLEAGGFPEDLFPSEDTVLNTVLAQRGTRLGFDPGVAVRHLHRLDLRALLEHNRVHGQAYAEACRRVELPGRRLPRHPVLRALAIPPLRCALLLGRLCRHQPWLAPLLLVLTPLVLPSVVAWTLGFVRRGPPRARPIAATRARSSVPSSVPPVRDASVSVVVPFRNAAHTLPTTLRALSDSTLAPREVVCVDDRSTDGGEVLVRRFAEHAPFPVRLVRAVGDGGGAAAARNRGARAATGSLLLFVDADVVVERDTIERLVAESLSTGCGVAVARLRGRSLQPGTLADFQAHLVHTVQGAMDPADASSLGSHCALLWADVFHAAGGFDERYDGATVEDFELGHRLRRAGHVVRIVSGAFASHNHRYDGRAFARNYYGKARDLVRLVLRSPDARATSGGYFARRNAAALAAIVGAGAAVVAAAWDRRAILLLPCGTLLLGLLWWRYLADVARSRGVRAAARFAALRVVVTILGGAGIAAGAWAEVLARAGARSSRARGRVHASSARAAADWREAAR